MDYIKRFDIELEREYYYAGDKAKGWVLIDLTDNVKVRGVRVFLRGKAHVEWKVTKGGERRTVKEDQYFLDDRTLAWGKDKHDDIDGSIPIMPKGSHRFPFEFQLPDSTLPCSFESRIGNIRYYLRVIIDIPYASPPQGLKYLTIIGPQVDANNETYLSPINMVKISRSFCCKPSSIRLEATLERSAYCNGENIKLNAEIENGSDSNCWIIVKLVQHVEYKITKCSVLGLMKENVHEVWKYRGQVISPHTTVQLRNLQDNLQLPVLPTTLFEVCRLLEIYYVLRVSVEKEKSGEKVHIDFPLDVAVIPYKTRNEIPQLTYQVASDNVEGGMYISPEFQLGQVYDGTDHDQDIILYRPVYVSLKNEECEINNHQGTSSDSCLNMNDSSI